MRQLTPEGQQLINNLAQRYNFSADAVFSLLQSVINGNGSMAQFSHPEFGGSGQWMKGGMIMLGDMFNNGLKNSVGGLCQELSNLIANQPGLIQTGSFQSQSQGNQEQNNYSGNQQQNNNGPMGAVSLFVPPPAGSSGNWWPAGLQFPNSTGAQNNVRYAYFASIRRLAIEANGHVTLYDTLDHQIGGFSQQQSVGGSITFTSQYGLVDVNSLPIISIDNEPYQQPVQSQPTPSFNQAEPYVTQNPNQEADIFAAIEKLAGLKDKGILTDSEYSTKKAELLSRL
ncbi:MAG: SHOCT domain-containing protein [Methylococcaceae bacterium]|jgi:hypothetical protein